MSRSPLQLLLVSALPLTNGGCMNRWVQNYRPLADPALVASSPFYEHDCNPTQRERLVSADDLYRSGYVPVGRTRFLAAGGWVDVDNGYRLGDQVCADVTVVSVDSAGTTSGTLYLPGGTSTATVNSSSQTFGSGGVSSTYGTATISTPNPDVAVPYTTYWYTYAATYWAKTYYILGVIPSDIDREDRLRLDLPRGVRVVYVVKNTPAYETNVAEGDIITHCVGRQVRSSDDLLACTLQNAGYEIELQVYHADGVEETIMLELSQPPPGFTKWIEGE